MDLSYKQWELESVRLLFITGSLVSSHNNVQISLTESFLNCLIHFWKPPVSSPATLRIAFKPLTIPQKHQHIVYHHIITTPGIPWPVERTSGRPTHTVWSLSSTAGLGHRGAMGAGGMKEVQETIGRVFTGARAPCAGGITTALWLQDASPSGHTAQKRQCVMSLQKKGADEKDKLWDGCFALHLRDGTGEICKRMSDTLVRNTFAVLEPSLVNGNVKHISFCFFWRSYLSVQNFNSVA